MCVTYSIIIAPRGRRSIRRLSRDTQARVTTVVDGLAQQPRPANSEIIAGIDDHRRIRIGDYRVIYEISDVRLEVTIHYVGHRREVYDRFFRGL